MPHKFKIGAVVSYRPVDRLVSALRGTYIVTEHKPALDGQAARLPHQAPQRGLSSASRWRTSCRLASSSMTRDDDDPRAPYQVCEGDEVKETLSDAR